ncbi:PIG-L family deacetylase [Candidatus Saccharibacteria bacterium]|nr:MAG: PIG-L family deacetylase [Candidatus Saccharibacteria bacterium]
MTTAFNPLQPKVVLGVAAHPDDLEFSAAGSMAKFIAEGAQGYYFILTNANKGTSDRSLQPEQLRDMRREEQRNAGKILGLTDVFFGDYDDGCLQCSLDVKRDIARVIRQVKPDVVITMDPTNIYSVEQGMVNHTDHRAAGEATLDAVYPLARDHLSFPELLEAGLEPHKTKTILMSHFGKENYFVDISPHIETKLQALRAHASQLGDPDATCEMVKRWAASNSSKVGAQYAEGFVRLDLSI